MSPDIQLLVLEKRDADRMLQIEEALCALDARISNLEERLYLMATQLKAAEWFTAESYVIEEVTTNGLHVVGTAARP